MARYRTLAALLLILAVMTGLTSYSVTLYRLFCQVTGANGTTRRVAADDASPTRNWITVRFDTSTAPGLPWSFQPVQREIRLHPGQEALVFFAAENLSDQPLTGHATFNVTPEKAGIYFKKIQCFCFNEEHLAPHRRVEMPVEFFVDPKITTDADTADVHEITLAYTLFRSARSEKPLDLARFATPDAQAGARLFAQQCTGCHALDRNRTGPALGNLAGRRAGTVANYDYSAALRKAGFTWTAPRLEAWLADPQAMVPGAAMPVHVADPASRRDITAYLMAKPAT